MATYKGLTVELGADTKNLTSALRDASKGATQTARELKEVERALKLNPNEVRLTTRQMELLEEQVSQATKRLEVLKTAESQIGRQGMSSDQWTKLQAEIATTEARVESLRQKMASLGGTQATAIERLGYGLSSWGKSAEGTGKAMQAIGDGLTHTLTPAIVGAGAASVAAAVQMDTSLTNVRKTVDGTEQQYQALKDAAVEFSKTNAVSASEILDIQALGAQLGFSIDELQEFGEVVSGLDIATNMDAETAATEMAQFANITKLSHDEIANYGAAIVGLGNNFATTEADISAMAMRIAAAGTQVGMSQADILGLSTALSSLGVEAEAGGTAISTTISSIDKAVSTGGDELAAWASAAQTSAADFAAAWKSDPVRALGDVLSGMESATEQGGNMSLMLDELGINALRQTDVMKRMAGNSELVAEAVAKSNEEWERNTALDNEVANRNDSLAAKFEMVKNRVVAVADEVGGPLADALLAAIDAMEPLFSAIEEGAKAFSEMDEGTQRLVVSAAALAAAAGPLLSTFGKVPDLAVSIGQGLTGMVDKMKAGQSAAGALLGSFSGLKAGLAGLGIMAVVGLLGAFAAGLASVAAEQEEVARRQELANDALRGADEIIAGATASYDDASGSVDDLVDSYDDLLESVKGVADGFADSMDKVATDERLLDGYVETIEELSGQSDLTASEQARLAEAVEGYNEITGDSVGVTDAATGALSKNTEEIRANAEAWKERARAEAYSDAAKQYYEQEAAAAVELAKAQETVRQKQDEVNAAREAFYGYLDEHGQDGSMELAEMAQHLTTVQGELKTAQETAQGFSDTMQGAAANGDYLTTQAAILGSTLDQSIKDALVALPMEMQSFGYDAMSALSVAISEGSLTVDQAMAFLTQGMQGRLSALPLEMQQSGYEMAVMLAQGVSAGQVSVDQAIQLMDAGIVQAFAGLPVEMQGQGMTAMATLAQSISDGSITVEQAAQVLKAAAAGDLSTLPAELQGVGGEAVSTLASSMQSASGELSGNASALAAEVAGAFDGLPDELSQKGAEAVAQLSAAVAAGQVDAESAAQVLSAAATGSLEGLPDELRPYAEGAVSDFAAAIAAGEGPTGDAAAACASAAQKMQDVGDTYTWGYHLSSNLAAGINAGVPEIQAAAASAAAAAASVLKHSTPKKGPLKHDDVWGLHLAQNIADGMRRGTPLIRQASLDAAQTIADYIDHYSDESPEKGPLSPGERAFGVNLAKNLYDGMEEGRRLYTEPAALRTAQTIADYIDHYATPKPKKGPLSPGEKVFGLHLAKNFHDGMLDGDKKYVEKSSLKIAQTVADYIAHSNPKKGPLSCGEWVFGYHAATNFADGLYSGVGLVDAASEALAGAVEENLADIELQKYIDDMLAGYVERADDFKEVSTKIADYIWGVYYPSVQQQDWALPGVGTVYDSMKVLEAAGYDLDAYREKVAQYAEEQEDWNKKLADPKVSDSTREQYAEWTEELAKFQEMQGQLSASMEEMEEWQGLYRMKDDVISATVESERLASALAGINAEGVTFSQEFVDYISQGGEDVLSALEKLGEMGPEAIQNMSDSFRDSALAEREAELNARSLYVNSLKYTDFSTQRSQMLDFRETVLDVREAVYSDAGLSGAFERLGVSAEGFALDLESVKWTMEDFSSYSEGFVDSVSNGFQQFTKYGATSLDEWTENLRLNKAEAQDWANNLTEVFSKLPETVDSQAFREAILAGGMEQWGQVIDDMAAMTGEQMAQVVELYNSSILEGQLSAMEAFRALAPGEEFVGAIIEGIGTAQPALDGSMTTAATQANASMQATAPEWFTTGAGLAGQIAAGIQSQIDAIAAAAAATVSAAIAAAKSAASSGTAGYSSGGGASLMASASSAPAAASSAPRAALMARSAAPAATAQSAPRAATTNNTSVQMSFSIYTQPGQTVDYRRLAKEINRVQTNELRGRGLA